MPMLLTWGKRIITIMNTESWVTRMHIRQTCYLRLPVMQVILRIIRGPPVPSRISSELTLNVYSYDFRSALDVRAALEAEAPVLHAPLIVPPTHPYTDAR